MTCSNLQTIKTREETNRTLEVFNTVSKGELESFKRKGDEVLKTSKRKVRFHHTCSRSKIMGVHVFLLIAGRCLSIWSA
jgi:hypothetical protein